MLKIIPINSKKNGSLTTSFTASISFNKRPVPIINENEIELEMNGIGPMGPPGIQGNGIARIEKTSTSGIIDTYTIYFTDGREFSYEITNGIVYYYDGPYDVIPMPYSTQILPTENLVMRENVNISQIPYQEVSNPSGGYTATIGDII